MLLQGDATEFFMFMTLIDIAQKSKYFQFSRQKSANQKRFRQVGQVFWRLSM